MFYPSIETLFKLDPITHKIIKDEYRNDIFSLIAQWEWTEKIDGTNIRVEYKGHEDIALATMTIGGRTAKSEVPIGVINYINRILTVEKLHKVFAEKDVLIFGEGYGEKIQNGGDYIPASDPERQKFIVFDIVVAERYWLKRQDVKEICDGLGLDIVPLISLYIGIDDALLFVRKGFKSYLGDRIKEAEGLVGRTSIPLFDAKHRRVTCKLRTEDFR